MYSNVFLRIWSPAGLWPKFSCRFILAAYYMLAWRNWHTAAVAQALICLQFLFSTTSESPASCIWSLHNPLRNLGQRMLEPPTGTQCITVTGYILLSQADQGRQLNRGRHADIWVWPATFLLTSSGRLWRWSCPLYLQNTHTDQLKIVCI